VCYDFYSFLYVSDSADIAHNAGDELLGGMVAPDENPTGGCGPRNMPLWREPPITGLYLYFGGCAVLW
jgi:hypothetical protein